MVEELFKCFKCSKCMFNLSQGGTGSPGDLWRTAAGLHLPTNCLWSAVHAGRAPSAARRAGLHSQPPSGSSSGGWASISCRWGSTGPGAPGAYQHHPALWCKGYLSQGEVGPESTGDILSTQLFEAPVIQPDHLKQLDQRRELSPTSITQLLTLNVQILGSRGSVLSGQIAS